MRVAGHRPILPAHFLQFCQADRVLVILDPAVLVADNLIDELLDLTPGGQVACALPADPRSAGTVACRLCQPPRFRPPCRPTRDGFRPQQRMPVSPRGCT
jgi:hypothetical protein